MTEPNTEKINRRIHEWRGLCWHESNMHPSILKEACKKCGKRLNGNWNADILRPSYTDGPAAMLDLIEAVRVKGGVVDMNSGTKDEPDYMVELVAPQDNWSDRTTHYGKTLPMAVALAVYKCIEEADDEK